MTREERIEKFERILDRAEEVLRRAEEARRARQEIQPEWQEIQPEWQEIQPALKELEAYYTGPAWREDYEADEAGLLPPGLKRGVLSEDGIDRVLEAFRSLGECREEQEESAGGTGNHMGAV